MTLLDANIIVRYVTGDDPVKTPRCERFLNAVAKAEQRVVMTSLCLAEVAWVLDRLYHYPKPAVVAVLRRLLNTAGIELTDRPLWVAAVDLYETHAMNLIDAYHVAFMQTRGITTLYSYDSDFDHVTGLTRREP